MVIDTTRGWDPAAKWFLIPDRCHVPLQRYLEFGEPKGSFLTAVLSNDLIGAVQRGDKINRIALSGYVEFLTDFVDPDAYGSFQKVSDWIAAGGARGRATS